MQTMNEVCYEKTYSMVQKGHQVMVFVHARNATHQTAMVLKELAQKYGHLKHFEPDDSAEVMRAMKSIGTSPNKQLAELFAAGFSCHHAGMLRSDRYSSHIISAKSIYFRLRIFVMAQDRSLWRSPQRLDIGPAVDVHLL